MNAHIETEVSAEAVVQAMFQDSGFALAMWKEIAEKLHMGLMLDECMDLVREGFSTQEKQAFQSSLVLMSACIGMQVEYEAIEPNEPVCDIQIKASWSSGEKIDAEFLAINHDAPAEIIKLIRATQDQTHD